MGVDPRYLEAFAAAGMYPVGESPRTDKPHAGGYNAMRVPMRSNGQSEEEFLNEVIVYAQANQWACAHFRAARTEHGWRTAVSGDGKGWVDLVMVRERVVYAELKTAKGRLSQEQKAWSDRLKAAQCEVYLWRPASWDEIRRVLGS